MQCDGICRLVDCSEMILLQEACRCRYIPAIPKPHVCGIISGVLGIFVHVYAQPTIQYNNGLKLY